MSQGYLARVLSAPAGSAVSTPHVLGSSPAHVEGQLCHRAAITQAQNTGEQLSRDRQLP